MLADFYGRILVPPTVVEHDRPGLGAAVAAIRRAAEEHRLGDLIVAVERTGHYHMPIKRAFTAANFETRIVHPLATHHFRMPADPGNKTDDTDLMAIHRAAANGFGLAEPPLDDVHEPLRLLARHRRDLVRKNATLRNQILAHLDAILPGYSGLFADVFANNVALHLARAVPSVAEARRLGAGGLAELLDRDGIRTQRRIIDRIAGWAARTDDVSRCNCVHHNIFMSVDDERRGRLEQVAAAEREMAGFLARSRYVVLLSMPGVGVVTAAELAAEMGPIANYAGDAAITGRAGIYPSRYQSDGVDRCDGPLVRRGNRRLRAIVLMIGSNLLSCNRYFIGLKEEWRGRGMAEPAMRVRAGKKFCRIAYRMVAGGQVFRHPSCRGRDAILAKLTRFHVDHRTGMEQTLADLKEAVNHIPMSEHATEAESLAEALQPSSSRRSTGPRRLGEILPGVLARMGITGVESSTKGDADLA
jgi:transposase